MSLQHQALFFLTKNLIVMKEKKETFNSLMKAFDYRYETRSVFDDFLTMVICAVTQNLHTGKSYYEELYLETIAKYQDDSLRFHFPKMFACLTLEMDERFHSDSGNDILGEFYEENIYRKGAQQYFTPWSICSFMARCSVEESKEVAAERPLRILDPACGSGRMLIAAEQVAGQGQEYYGIDIDLTCVKMCAINLFMNGMFHSEVLCADALVPEDFRASYRPSLLPLGIFMIDKKEESPLWHLLRNSLNKTPKENGITLPSEERVSQSFPSTSSQLTLF
jgi:type I restriction-modification system DNA methylase subunit